MPQLMPLFWLMSMYMIMFFIITAIYVFYLYDTNMVVHIPLRVFKYILWKW